MNKEEFWPVSISSFCLSRKKRSGVYKSQLNGIYFIRLNNPENLKIGRNIVYIECVVMCYCNVSSELFTPIDVYEMREGECLRVKCKLFFVRFGQNSNVSTYGSKSRRYEFHVLDSTPLRLLGACCRTGPDGRIL